MNPNPENDKLCASIISNVIARGEEWGESRTASSTAPIIRNEAYALRQKLFGDFIPSAIEEESESRAAAITITTPINQGSISPNQAYELRKILFGPA